MRLVYVFVLFGFFACKFEKKNVRNENRPTALIFDLSEESNYKLSNLIDSVELISLPKEKIPRLTKIDKVIKRGDLLYILDREFVSKLFIYNYRTRDLIATIGNLAESKHRIRIFNFDINIFSGNLEVYENPENLHLFDSLGNYKNTLQVPFGFTSFTSLSSSERMFYRNYMRNPKSSRNDNASAYNIVLHDQKSQSFNEYLPYLVSNYTSSSVPSSNTNFFRSSDSVDGIVHFIQKGRNIIYSFREKKLLETYVVNFCEDSIEDDLFQKIESPMQLIDSLKKFRHTYIADLFFENNRFVIFNYLSKGLLKTAFFDKQSMSAIKVNRFVNDINAIPVSAFSFVSENKLISFYPPNFFSNKILANSVNSNKDRSFPNSIIELNKNAFVLVLCNPKGQ